MTGTISAVENSRVVVIGAGQAGLAVSHELTASGVDHVVLERSRLGQTWRGRWDSFCLVTPNWTMSLPGLPYDGDEPEGFLPRDAIVRHLERYAASFAAPVREGVSVGSLELGSHGGFLLRSSGGDIQADAVVLCTGAYQRPHRPDVAGAFPNDVQVFDAEDYVDPDALPSGGQWASGCDLPRIDACGQLCFGA